MSEAERTFRGKNGTPVEADGYENIDPAVPLPEEVAKEIAEMKVSDGNFRLQRNRGGNQRGCIAGRVIKKGVQCVQLRRARSLYGASPSNNFGPKGCLMKTQTCTITIPDPMGQRLNWYKPPLSVLIIKKIYDDHVSRPFKDLVKYLVSEKQMIVYVEAKTLDEPSISADRDFLDILKSVTLFQEDKDNLTDKIDLVVCLGGDGTLLYTSSLFQLSCPPVLSFHLGSLGFLTPFQFENFREEVDQVIEGNTPLILRSRLKAVICKAGSACLMTPHVKDIDHSTAKTHILTLNEVVIDRGPSPYLCNVDLYVEKKLVTSVQGDGLIISTPTGSTAYAAAAGASMIHPQVPAIVITPVCPHSLSFRPIVVPAGVEVMVMISPDARNTAWASFDGRSRQELQQGDTLRITTSTYPVPCICTKDPIGDWFDSLGKCLHWNVRKQQKHMLPQSSSSASLDSLDDRDL
ncbi:NAD kinase [Lingula anatina]|uniref:NAD(+) kinase n=1 Tax=Lingula anatina TaxID=7574 RepID=A0A1S3HBB7_LINAN|nr:NAD kinase [Lingula anatina]|eukprot:XP_013382776.1 NAD kinase [Lingula anatina]